MNKLATVLILLAGIVIGTLVALSIAPVISKNHWLALPIIVAALAGSWIGNRYVGKLLRNK